MISEGGDPPGFQMRVRSHAATLSAHRRVHIVARHDPSPTCRRDRSPPQVGGGAARSGVRSARGAEAFVRRHGLDLLIVVAAIVAVVEVLLRDDDAEHRRRRSPPSPPRLLVLPLLARRRSPFMAPAWLWLLAAALSFLDGRLVVVLGRRLRRRAWSPRS